MSRVSEDSIRKLQDFIASLPMEKRQKCALCNDTLTHVVKQGEVISGAGTATVTRALADDINEDAAPGDKVTGDKLRDRVRYAEGGIKWGNSPNNSQFRTSFTGENEWYTPKVYIDAAREVMGSIDLDPASSDVAQELVQANEYYTKDNDGLSKHWHGKVWLNPPYSQPLIVQFIEKCVSEYKGPFVEECIVLTNNYTDTAWFHLAESVAGAICFTKGRIRFEGAKGSPTQGSAFFYMGQNVSGFTDVFSDYGFVR